MSYERPNKVSVIDPISPAIDRVKLMLFSPFDLSKWFVIGFCAWLAYLGGGGGGGPRYNFPQTSQEHKFQIGEVINTTKEYISANLGWIIPVVVTVLILIIGIFILITWLNSRGKFMFLHCVAENKAQVKIPWHKFRNQSNSLFLFRIVLGIIGLVIVGIPIIGIVILIVMMATGPVPSVFSILGIVILGLTIVALSIVLFLVKKFTFDFVVPIMFLQMSGCVAGWREFMAVFSANKLRFALFLLFQIVISIVVAAIIGIGFCVGCCLCCASCLLFVPYIGTVILLPILVFKRAYSLYYLQQFGPRFDLFGPEMEAAQPI